MNEFENIYHTYFKDVFLYMKSLSRNNDIAEEITAKNVYHIAAWDSVWDRKIMKNELQNIVLNPNGEKVSAVYYYETDGSGEVLLYEEAQNPCGVVIKQPKLGLYLVCALITATG